MEEIWKNMGSQKSTFFQRKLTKSTNMEQIWRTKIKYIKKCKKDWTTIKKYVKIWKKYGKIWDRKNPHLSN